MKVEIDTAQIHQLETQVEQFGGLLTAVMSKQKNRNIVLTPDDMGKGRVTIEVDGDTVTLEYHE